MLVDPEKMNDKEIGASSILKKIIMVIVMLGVYNFIFNGLYFVQKTVVESNVISNLLLPYKIVDDDLNNFGRILSEELMFAFYQNETFTDSAISSNDQATIDNCKNYSNAFRNQIINSGRFDLGYNCLNESITISDSTGTSAGNQERNVFVVNYNWILCVVAGGFAAYLLFMYCFKIGLRMVQLMFLEIIAPVAIVSYLAPKKDTMFNKWTKLYVATYVDVFIRIVIINFVIFLIATIFTTNGGDGNFIFWDSIGGKPDDMGSVSFITVVIVLALLTFAKKAPDLIKELFGSSASKLGFGVSMKDIVGLQKGIKTSTGAIGGALGGAAVGLLGGGLGGFAGGLVKGGLSGSKAKNMGGAFTGAWKNQSKANASMAKVRANGGSRFGHTVANMQKNLGLPTAYDNDEIVISNLQTEVDMYNTASKEAESEAIKNGTNYSMFSNTAKRKISLRELEKLKDDQRIDTRLREKYDTEYRELLKASSMFNLDYGLAVEKAKVEFNDKGDFVSLRNDESGRLYTNINDVNAIQDKSKEIGGSNATIDENMKKLVGDGRYGRGKDGKKIRNENSSKITEIKLSDKYKSHKANSGK